MRPLPGGTGDPDRRRAAAKLAELLRSDDGELSGYAKRHLPGRAVEPESLRALRASLAALARLVELQGKHATAEPADRKSVV